jgi:uncharacterized protein (DUF1697 family)
MQTFVALMRGINVGSTRSVPMVELRALCTKAGLKRPETYIQSGNLIVDADGGADRLRRQLEKAMTARFGFAVDVVVRTATEWERYVAAIRMPAMPMRGRRWCIFTCRAIRSSRALP